MILLSWNARGLNARVKRSSIRSLINLHSPLFVFIQETKIEVFSPQIIKSMWKYSHVSWAFSPSSGNSGGLLSLWNEDSFAVESSIIEKHWIAILGEIRSTHFKCSIVNVYNPCSVSDRAEVWKSLCNFQLSSKLPCLLVGDFNEVLDISDRGSQHISNNGSHDFKCFFAGNAGDGNFSSKWKLHLVSRALQKQVRSLVYISRMAAEFPINKSLIAQKDHLGSLPITCPLSREKLGAPPHLDS